MGLGHPRAHEGPLRAGPPRHRVLARLGQGRRQGRRPHRQHQLGRRPARLDRSGQLRRGQGGHRGADGATGGGVGSLRRARQRHRPRCTHPHDRRGFLRHGDTPGGLGREGSGQRVAARRLARVAECDVTGRVFEVWGGHVERVRRLAARPRERHRPASTNRPRSAPRSASRSPRPDSPAPSTARRPRSAAAGEPQHEFRRLTGRVGATAREVRDFLDAAREPRSRARQPRRFVLRQGTVGRCGGRARAPVQGVAARQVRQRMGRYHLAEGVRRPRRDQRAARHLQPGAGALRRAVRRVLGGHRHDRADADRARHRGAEAALPRPMLAGDEVWCQLFRSPTPARSRWVAHHGGP